MFTSLRKLVLLSFYRLRKSWVRIFDSFKQLVLLFAIINAYSFENLKPNWEKQREIWDNTHFLTRIFKDLCLEDASVGLNCSSTCAKYPWDVSLRLLIFIPDEVIKDWKFFENILDM